MVGKIIENLFSSFRNFIYRDYFYIFSGFIICFYINYFLKIDFTPFKDLPVFVKYISIITIFYILGYIIQEVFSLLRIVRTTYCKNRFDLWLTRKFLKVPKDYFINLPAYIIDEKICFFLDNNINKNTQERMNRTINLMQLCSSMGSCLLFCFILTIILSVYKNQYELFWTKLILFFFSGIIICLINRMKNTQYYSYVIFTEENIKSTNS